MSGTSRGSRDADSLRTAAERAALGAATRYARVCDLSSPAEAAYLEALPAARREILHRFVRGVIRGEPAGLSAAVVSPEPSAVPDEPTPLDALERAHLQSVAESPSESARRRLALVAFPGSESALIVPVAARHGYDRLRFAGPVRRWSRSDDRGGTAGSSDGDSALERLSHPVDLVPLLECEGAFRDAEQAERIRAEVAESVANLALARLAAAVHERRAAGRSDASGPLEAIPSAIPAATDAAAFERLVTDGHPFHPSGKIRRGMTAGEGLAYAPEFSDRIDLRFVAVARKYALETRASESDDRLTERLFGTFDGLRGALERAVPAERSPDAYAVVPVHPLQYHRTIPDRYADRRADGRVVPIGDYARPVTPQLNLRTVVPHENGSERSAGDDGARPHLKLAIPVQTTNVVRTLSPHAVSNGPQVTAVARTIARRESLETLGLLAEPAAACYYPPNGPHPSGEGYDDARHLSGLLRSPPAGHPLVPADGTPVVASSLVADAPTTGRPLVRDLIEQYGSATGVASTEDAALSFLERYVAVVVPEQLRLLCAYGVALESHLQNSLVVFDGDARPTATLVRDLGGIRVHRGRLAERGLSIDPYPDSDLDADGEAALHRKLYYALFQNHLAELVATIAHALPVDERDCWALIREECERAFARLRDDPAVPNARVRRDERALVADPATHKALTAMRLRGKRHEYVTSEVSNPLARDG
ncbi:IucA/IucC family protein [Halopiger aswanensis]|uniref:Siderophore synthetase component n=1 Tax=Halopiger aswanensis TaxID=148449 RepID=A0A3R7FVY8_9EURY|nr:IucA/IucC family protein [Halopiger aswanensis]RKD95363.1 siderophore synthetase component [Halopiger aswanensis]